jgi:hypothetical protein
VLGVAMLAAAALLLWEGRGQTFFVDEWTFGFGARTGHDLAAFLAADNGHLALLPVLVTKTSLQLFGATELPLRLLAVGLHLGIALLFFLTLRRSIGSLGALAPTLLLLFLGSASDVLIGSHAMPIQIAVATGLGAWLALAEESRVWDAVAAALLVAGIASNGFAVPFIAGAAAIVLLAGTRHRLWVIAAPLLVYGLWRLGYGPSGQSDFGIDHLAAMPAFAFDSLAAELGALTGLFTEAASTRQSFALGPGQALAGATLVALVALAVARDYRFPRAAIPAVVALLGLWLFTGVVASPARMPFSSRYLYPGVILVLLVFAAAIAATPWRRQGSVALACVCAVALLPNLRELDYGGGFFRRQSDQNRAVMAAADLVAGRASGETGLEVEAEPAPGAVADMTFSLAAYRAAAERFGSPAFSLAELEAAPADAREGADWMIRRSLSLGVRPARSAPARLPPGLETAVAGGELSRRDGCLAFTPRLADAGLTIAIPAGGLWIRPDVGPPVAVALRRFGDSFSVAAGAALPGRAAELRLAADPAGRGWKAHLSAPQPTLVCGL